MYDKRILVTGSRNWSDVEAIRAALVHHGPATVIHGGARGADAIAGRIAEDFGWPTVVHKANWRQFGKKAGPMRNAAMVEAGADLCLAFPLPDSIGTWDCVKRAKKAGIPVVVRETWRDPLVPDPRLKQPKEAS